MDVYEHEREPDDIPKGAKYVGCFRDDIPGRALTLKYTSSTKMDYDVRIDLACRERPARIHPKCIP